MGLAIIMGLAALIWWAVLPKGKTGNVHTDTRNELKELRKDLAKDKFVKTKEGIINLKTGEYTHKWNGKEYKEV